MSTTNCFNVLYEIHNHPSHIEMELICHSAEEQEEVFQERLSNANCKNVRKATLEALQDVDSKE
jgi:hypothetical protein